MSREIDTLRLPARSLARPLASAAHLFVVLQCEQPLAPSSRFNLKDVDEVVLGRGMGEARRESDGGVSRLWLQLPDPYMSKSQAVLRRQGDEFVLHDGDSSNGTWVNGTRQSEVMLQDGDLLQLGSTFLSFRYFQSSETDIHIDTRACQPGELYTLLPELAQQFSMLKQVAQSSVPVVVLGESGTGKELVARVVHRISARDGAFVALNCGALSSTLLEAELFGYRKGAFSGANEDRPGLVRASHGGTLMLDEIGDLPAPGQTALLRVLQEREVLPLGCTRPVPVDLRMVCATHRDLNALSAASTFRADLLARISGYTLRLPPLRQRREDAGILVATLLTRLAGNRVGSISLSVEAGKQLVSADWPLNIRELEQCLAVALAFAEERITPEHLTIKERVVGRVTEPALAPQRALSHKDRADCLEFLSVLRRHGGNISAVARELGKERIQIGRLIKRYGIDPHDLPE